MLCHDQADYLLLLGNLFEINVLLVFLCLYTFLIGIKGLSSSIEGLSSPENIFPGDQVQLKKISYLNDKNEEVTLKKQWVEVITAPDENGDFNFIFAASSIGERIVDYPIHYRSRTYGSPQISRFRDGYKLFLNFLNSIVKLNASKY